MSGIYKQKDWTAVEMELDPRMQVVIAGYAALLINQRLDLGVYPRTREIIVRPAPYNEEYESLGRDVVGATRLGEAWYRGPVILAWSAIRPLLDRRPDPHNVIIHEFAHKLDFLDGSIDGTPPLASRVDLQRWASVFGREYERLVEAANTGQRSLLNKYGATNAAEFFAVATETFYGRPKQLRSWHPEVFQCLQDFFQQDPTEWNMPER